VAAGTGPAKVVKRSRYPVPTKLPETAENCHHCKVKKEYWLHCPIVDKHRYLHRAS
jgi:hypothetical protein